MRGLAFGPGPASACVPFAPPAPIWHNVQVAYRGHHTFTHDPREISGARVSQMSDTPERGGRGR
jgi:hypothetical protein